MSGCVGGRHGRRWCKWFNAKIDKGGLACLYHNCDHTGCGPGIASRQGTDQLIGPGSQAGEAEVAFSIRGYTSDEDSSSVVIE